MWKIRIIAAFIAILITAITAYVAPIVYGAYQTWSASLSVEQRQWFNWSQVGIGVLIAVYGLSLWRKKK